MYPYISGLLSFILSLLLTPILIKVAYLKNWVVAPRVDRWHKKPTALMGGIAIFISFSLAIFITSWFSIYWIIYFASLIMFLVGLVDDLKEVKPVVKFVSQIFCTLALIYHGYYFGGGLLSWAGIPLTFFWVIGITNALNLLDNMDGLAAGIAGIIATISAVLIIMNGDAYLASLGLAIAGASFGFLVYNFNPAKIFMGDSGSLFLGFSISFLSIAVQKNMGSSSSILVMLIPIGLMAIPIMDTTLVTVKRLFAGRRIDQGGRDHSSHRLVALGLSEKKAVLVLYGISIIWGGVCILMHGWVLNNLLLTVLLLTILSVFFSIALSKVKVYNESEEKLIYLRSRGYEMGKGNSLFFRLFLMNKKIILGIFTDILIIYFAFFIASESTHTNISNGYALLGVFISVKIIFFYISNLYSRMWRYMAVLELGGYFLSTISSTLIIAIILFFKSRLSSFSPYFLMIDFLVTFAGIIVSRLTYRLIIESLYKGRRFQKKVLIYGAGDSGFLLVKELLQNKKYELSPVGWIDDDDAKHNMLLYGFRIWGGNIDLLKICIKKEVSVVLISSNNISAEKETEIRTLLQDHNIQVGRFNVTLAY